MCVVCVLVCAYTILHARVSPCVHVYVHVVPCEGDPVCVHACVYLGHCAQDGGGLWGGFRMLTVGVLRGPELHTEEGLEWPHRVLCHVACLAVVGEVMLKKPRVQGAIGLSRLRFVGLSLPLLGSSFGLAPV